MQSLIDALVLDRIGPAEATVGLVSLPVPRELAGKIAVDHATAGSQPVGWWKRNELARRELVTVVDAKGLPEKLRLKSGAAKAAPAKSAWQVTAKLTREKLEYKPAPYYNVGSLRGVPAEDCTTAEYELQLAYGSRQIAVQFTTTGPNGDTGKLHIWQNVHVDRLWANAAAEAVRVGGIIYNGDTFLWVDLYLILFANGVAHAAAHFNNTKLHITGYDFQGLPVIRFMGRGVKAVDGTLPADGSRFDLGAVKLNLEDAAILSSASFPASLRGSDGEVLWQPFSRTFNPQLQGAPEFEWPVGMSRTVRFQFSLSDAPAVVARYRVPSWWYTLADEPWPGGYLPVSGDVEPFSREVAKAVRQTMVRGRFDAGSAGYANDGYAGQGLLRVAQITGDADTYRDGLDYCYYWNDIAIDHSDYTVHQWIGGWPWKTCAYSKFRDVVMGYLETGDPGLLDTAEMCADAYWAWYRSNWPRNSIGRDNFEVGGWSLLRKFTRSERSIERTREFVRMITDVLQTRGSIGGQMGGGPHPGYLSSLYMSGVTMISLLDVAEAELEEGHRDRVEALHPILNMLHERWMADDVELFPSSFGQQTRATWGWSGDVMWRTLSGRIYPEWARMGGGAAADAGLRKRAATPTHAIEDYMNCGRPGDNLIHPLFADALITGARVAGNGIEVNLVGDPDTWPTKHVIHSPWGHLELSVELGDGRATFRATSPREFPLTIKAAGGSARGASTGTIEMPVREPAVAR